MLRLSFELGDVLDEGFNRPVVWNMSKLIIIRNHHPHATVFVVPESIFEYLIESLPKKDNQASDNVTIMMNTSIRILVSIKLIKQCRLVYGSLPCPALPCPPCRPRWAPSHCQVPPLAAPAEGGKKEEGGGGWGRGGRKSWTFGKLSNPISADR